VGSGQSNRLGSVDMQLIKCGARAPQPADHRLDEVGRRVRAFREASGISQEELPHRAGLHRTYIGAVGRGERNLSITNLYALADGLAVAVQDLLPE
jgi:DNA-binding XRE family transcriptional regulator